MFSDVLRDLHVQEDQIENVMMLLDKLGATADPEGFSSQARVPEASFGGSPEGSMLGYHHSRAQNVIEETIRGIKRDISAIHDTTRKAMQMVQEADAGAGRKMDANRERVTGEFRHEANNSYTDSASDRARNSPATASSPTGEGS